MTKILVIEDDESIRSNILDLVEAEGFEGVVASNGVEGVDAAVRSRPDVIICDIMMPELDGFGVLTAIREREETALTPFIFLTARAERADIRAGMNLGADDYLTKPFTRAELLGAIETRLRRHQRAIRTLGVDSGTWQVAVPTTAKNVIIRSKSMRALYEEAGRVARGMMSVLILGETGVGKEILAHEIHRASPRAEGPFIPLNCAALSETLLESELFGHEKGAFTGATRTQSGVFESADGGTLFLDEIGELAPSIQAKLLRVLEDRRVLRVGSRKPREVDVRVITATNRDVEADVEANRFRRDLFFRINGVTLEIPPLRERGAEIEPLAEQFAAVACAALGRGGVQLADETLAIMGAYRWPGNVRELRNVVERSVALCRGDDILPEHLAARVRGDAGDADASPMAAHRVEVAQLERKRIVEALDACDGNQTRAAEMLGMSRRTLVNRLNEYNLPRPRKKPR